MGGKMGGTIFISNLLFSSLSLLNKDKLQSIKLTGFFLFFSGLLLLWFAFNVCLLLLASFFLLCVIFAQSLFS